MFYCGRVSRALGGRRVVSDPVPDGPGSPGGSSTPGEDRTVPGSAGPAEVPGGPADPQRSSESTTLDHIRTRGHCDHIRTTHH